MIREKLLSFYVKKKNCRFDQKRLWLCCLDTGLLSLGLHFRKIIYLFWALFIKCKNKLSSLERKYL